MLSEYRPLFALKRSHGTLFWKIYFSLEAGKTNLVYRKCQTTWNEKEEKC